MTALLEYIAMLTALLECMLTALLECIDLSTIFKRAHVPPQEDESKNKLSLCCVITISHSLHAAKLNSVLHGFLLQTSN